MAVFKIVKSDGKISSKMIYPKKIFIETKYDILIKDIIHKETKKPITLFEEKKKWWQFWKRNK
jgi:hypothetical protein